MEQNLSKPNAGRRVLLAVCLHAFLFLLTVAMVSSLVFSFSPVLDLDWRWMAHGSQVCPSLKFLFVCASYYFCSPLHVIVLETLVLGLLILDWHFCRNLVRRGAEATLGWYSCGIATISVAALLIVLMIVSGYFRGWGEDMVAQDAFHNRDWVRLVMLREEVDCSFQEMPLQDVIAKLNKDISHPRKRIVLDVSRACRDLPLTYQPVENRYARLGTVLDIVCAKLRDVYGLDANWGIENNKVVVHCHRMPPAATQSTVKAPSTTP